MIQNVRRYDIDWLRVIAIGLLIIYHIAVGFQPFGVLIGFIQSSEPMQSLWVPMTMLNVWRIPLLFFVSGMGVCFAIKKRNWKQLLLERTTRIFIPFVFGFFFIVPLHVWLWQQYYNQDLQYFADQGHLWFLANIFAYVLLLTPVFFYLRNNVNGRFHQWLIRLFKNPLSLLVVTAFFILEVLVVNPESFEMYAKTIHGYILGFMAFFFGFIFIYTGESFWPTILKWRWYVFSFALTLYLVRLIVFRLIAPYYLITIESCAWTFAVFGFAYKYLNRPSNALSYLSQGAYPIYILHMFFQYLTSYFLMPFEMPALLKFFVIVLFTTAGCFAVYDLLIRRVWFLRPLFGLKIIKK